MLRELRSVVVSTEFQLDTNLMSWEIKALPYPTMYVEFGLAFLMFFFGCFYFYGWSHEDENTKNLILASGPVPMIMLFIFWIGIVRQKTCYHYRFTEKGGEVDYWLHFPKWAPWVFKGVSISAFIVVTTIFAIFPISLLSLVGPAGGMLIAARLLFSWKNEIKHRKFEWSRFHYVVIDRKRKKIVFEGFPFFFEVFLAEDQMECFLEVMRPRMPLDTTYVEGTWKR